VPTATLKYGGAPADADHEVMRMPTSSKTIVARLGREDGYTLIELLTVLVLLGIVLGALVTSFTVGIREEVSQSRREGAYATGRVALTRMRLDIHCASGGEDSVEANAYGGFTLTLTETSDSSGTGWCPGVIPAGTDSAGVQWCTIPYVENPDQFRLYRFLGIDPTECDGGAGSTFEADFIAQPKAGWPHNALVAVAPAGWAGNIWPTPSTCAATWLPSIAIDLDVALDPVDHPTEHYELRDAIALRNASRCV
jgi:prepilin-type N-terminal cleavage/methylation domain-containing protein